MKKQYIAPKTLIISLNNQCALMAGSFNETLKTESVSDGDGFTQYGRQGRFSDWNEEDFEY